MILRLHLELEIDTHTQAARVVNEELARPCPNCGKLMRPRYQHCSIACRSAARARGLEHRPTSKATVKAMSDYHGICRECGEVVASKLLNHDQRCNLCMKKARKLALLPAPS